ncbi:toll/interleukin-1 receptor domain-containing protein [Streptomyces sp. NBC_00467]|uniref:toll/interleukin-1 receptor domain-containing protein n=1 Tax=Streptomyces sp. NBC_00467 TaxID=2975752 RepID=UPI002E17A49B
MNSDEPVGFWSYTHRDNDLDRGRIGRLAESIAHEFEIITGEELKVFVDNKDISWGDAWRVRIDAALSGTTFLIPIVTPAFLKSQECRREVITFAGHAASSGLEELLLPIHYVNVPQLEDGEPNDELVALIARRQWIDWRQLRLEDEDSPQYRQAINRLAVRLSKILEEASTLTPDETAAITEHGEDEPGLLEEMASMEAALPEWQAALDRFGPITEDITAKMAWATQEMSASDSRGGGFAGRVRVTQELASRLGPHVGELAQLSSDYSAALLEVDPGIIGIIRNATVSELNDEEERLAEEFFEVIRRLVVTARESMPSLQEFADSAGVLAQGSRHLRPVMNQIKEAVQKVVDGQTVIEEWGRMIDEYERRESRPENPDPTT